MSEMPERVWCWDGEEQPRGWSRVGALGGVEYVRADLYSAAAANERARIVAWLRERRLDTSENDGDLFGLGWLAAAAAIASGCHAAEKCDV